MYDDPVPGTGHYSVVYQCRKRLDGAVYAVKRSRHSLESEAEKEVRPTTTHGQHHAFQPGESKPSLPVCVLAANGLSLVLSSGCPA